MNRIRELFKSNKFILLFSMILTSVTILFFNALGDLILNPEFIIMPALSLLLGPFAILGFVITEGIYLCIANPGHTLYHFISIILLFISNMFLWKLWYSIMNEQGHEIPNLNSSYNIVKLFSIFLIYLVIIYGLFSGIVEGTPLSEYLLQDMNIIPSLSMIVMLLGIHIFIKYKIRPYTPEKQIKLSLPEKSYPITLVVAIVIGLANILAINNRTYSLTMTVLIILLILIYMTKPFNKNSIKDKLNLNIFNKINASLFLILLIMLPLITLPTYIILPLPDTYLVLSDFSYLALKFFTLILIPVLVYFHYLEKNMVKPIHKLSESLSGDITNQEDYQKLKDDLNSINVNNELKSLSESLLKMESDLNLYGKQLVEVTSRKERLETELKLAHDIQNSMIPKNFEEINDEDDFEIWGLMEPAREVGGDFYDYFQIDEDNFGFVIGDVSGKGIIASLIMVKTMTLIQDYAKHIEDISEVFYEVNNLLCEGNVENLFVTCWIGKINIKTKKLSFVNAGHNPPLIKQNETFEYFDMDPGVVLGIMEDISYNTSELQLKSGDTIILYTDGITDANSESEEFYGDERLKNIINKHKDDDLDKIINSVEKDIEDFCGNQEQFDDTTLFAIKLR